jgi:uncharacterized membrane protein (DUF106 family)
MVFESVLNPIFSPLLRLPILWSIILISLLIAVVITFVYKWMTDQHLMKALKDDIKKFQKEMKEFKQDPKKVMEIQKRAMQTNMKYMMHSMKPTLITFIPIIIIFGWLNANLAYAPIMPDTEFTTTAIFEEGTTGMITLTEITPEGVELLVNNTQEIVDSKAVWKLKGESGEYILEYDYNEKTYNTELLITNQQAYKEPVKPIKKDNLKLIQIDNQKIKPLNLFGWKLGWLGTYIIFSIVFSMTLRKILKLH